MHSFWEIQTFFSAALNEQSFIVTVGCFLPVPWKYLLSLRFLFSLCFPSMALFLCPNGILGSFLCSIILPPRAAHTSFRLWEPPENDAGPWQEICYTCMGQCSFRAPWKNSFLLGKVSTGHLWTRGAHRSIALTAPECSAFTGLCRSRFCQISVVSLSGGLAGTGLPWAVFQGGAALWYPDVADVAECRCALSSCRGRSSWRELELALSIHCFHHG